MSKNVEYVITLKDKYSTPLKNADNETKKFSKTVNTASGILKGLMPVAVGAMAVMAFKKMTNIAMGFEKEMSNVRAISQANGVEFQNLQNQAEELGRNTVFSATQAAEGMRFLSMAGFTVKQTMDALPGTLDLAAAGSIGLGQAADIASNVLTQFGLEAAKMNAVNDILIATTSKTNTNIEQLAEGLKYTGTTAKILKMPLEETSAVLGVLANAGLQGSMGGTSLNTALLEMASVTSPTSKAIRALGVETHNSNGEFIGLTSILKQFEERGVKSTQVLDIFGMRGGRAMGTLVEAGSAVVEKFTQINKESAGIAKRVAEMKLDNLAGDLTLLDSAFEGFSISLGKKMNPTMRKTAQIATELLNGFEEIIRVPLSVNLEKDRIRFNALIGVMQNANTSIETRQRAVSELNDKYKPYLNNLDVEKASQSELNELRKRGNDEFLKTIKIQARKELIAEEEAKAAKLVKQLIEQEIRLEELKEKSKTASRASTSIYAGAGGGVSVGLSDYEATMGGISLLKQGNVKIQEELKRHQDKVDKITGQGIDDNASPAGGIPSLISGTITPDAKAERLTQTISSSAPKVFNINIEKLIETQAITTNTLSEGTNKIKQLITEALLEGLNDTQIMIAR